MKRGLLVFVAIAELAACAAHGAGGAAADSGADSAADSGADVDAGPGSGPGSDGGSGSGSDSTSGMPAMLVIGASSGTVPDAFDLTATGSAGSPYGAVSLSADIGTLDLGGGPAAAFVYATVTEGAYTLYDGFAISPTSWDAFYVYCHDGALADVYDERIGGHGMAYAAASGRCSATNTQTVAQVALPAFSIATPAPVGGYTVSGQAIRIGADGTGTLVLGAQTLPLIVFDDVDCTACGGSGWRELHSIVWNAADQRVVFVIVYLINGAASSVELSYARSLPDLGDPIGARTVPATWTAPAARIIERAPRGIPPPSLQLSR